jgi:hypothetical protein
MKLKITLNQFIDTINDPDVISAQLKMYNDWLEADNAYTIENLLPILLERLQEITNALSGVSASGKDCLSVVEDMADKSLATLSAAQSLAAIFWSTDMAWSHEFSDIVTTSSIVTTEIQNLMLGFLDQNFEELSLHLARLNDLLAKMNEMLSTTHFNSKWAWEKLQSISGDLQKYSDTIIGNRFGSPTSDLYRKYRELVVKAERFQGKLLKNKAVNPLISDQEIALCAELTAKLEIVGGLMHEWMNAVSRHEQFCLIMVLRIKIYRLLSDKLQIGI